MIIECQRCQTRFQLDATRIPAQGARVRCSRCQHRFHVDSPDCAPSAPGPPDAEGPLERREPSPCEDNATTLQPRRVVSDDPDLENPEFLIDPERQQPGVERGSSGGPDESFRAAPASRDLGEAGETQTRYDGRSLSQLDPAGLDLSAECDADDPALGRADPPLAADREPASSPLPAPLGDDFLSMAPPAESPPVGSGSLGTESEEGGPSSAAGGSEGTPTLVSRTEPPPPLEPAGDARVERISRSPSGAGSDPTGEAGTQGTFGPPVVPRPRSSGQGSDPWPARLRPAGLAAGMLLGIVIPVFLIAGMLAPPVAAPDVAAAGWRAREIQAFHASRGDGAVALVVEGQLRGEGPVPDVRLELWDSNGVPLDVEAHLLAGRLRPFDLEAALDRPVDTREAVARAGGFTFVIPVPSTRARRYRIRLGSQGGARPR